MKKIIITGKQLDNIPEGEEQMQYISTMTKALDAWADLNKERGFIIIACGESNKTEANEPEHDGKAMSAFGFGGNRKRLCALISVLLRKNSDFRNFMAIATKMCKYNDNGKETK